jgi:hypothetical protein
MERRAPATTHNIIDVISSITTCVYHESFEIKKVPEIRRGTCGIIYEGDWDVTKGAVQKTICKMLPPTVQSILQEIKIHKQPLHPDIVQLLAVSICKM